ncbi:MAG: hypothetical protein ACREHD_34030, partial [Pirellulales bacterium]
CSTGTSRLVPVESTTRLDCHAGPASHALDRDKPGTGRGLPPRSSISLSITARRGQAPIVAEQDQHMKD